MWDWAFWSIILEWLRPRSGCMLFEIIRGRWGQAYQRFHPPNPVWGMCACIYSSFVYVFSVSFNWTYQSQRQELIKGWSGACAVGFIMDLTTPNWVWLPWSLIFSCFELESRPNTVDMLDLTFLVLSRIARNHFVVWAIQEVYFIKSFTSAVCMCLRYNGTILCWGKVIEHNIPYF